MTRRQNFNDNSNSNAMKMATDLKMAIKMTKFPGLSTFRDLKRSDKAPNQFDKVILLFSGVM